MDAIFCIPQTFIGGLEVKYFPSDFFAYHVAIHANYKVHGPWSQEKCKSNILDTFLSTYVLFQTAEKIEM